MNLELFGRLECVKLRLSLDSLFERPQKLLLKPEDLLNVAEQRAVKEFSS